MKTIEQIFLFFLNSIKAFCGVKSDYDPTVSVPPARVVDKQEVVPMDRTKIPFTITGHDEELIKRAEKLFPDDVNRLKWILAVKEVRKTPTGWILDPDRRQNPRPNWGVPGAYGIPA
jgi:hypothetical protein